VVQVADKDPRDELSLWDRSPGRRLPVIQGQQASATTTTIRVSW